MSRLTGTTLSMHVKRMSLAASGGNYVVNFHADITLTSTTTIEVTIAQLYPMESYQPDPRDIEAAQQAIQQGCAKVLDPMHCGASVIVTGLVIHPIDFKPRQYASWTAFELQRCLDECSGNAV